MTVLRVTADTFFKLRPIQSSELGDRLKYFINSGNSFDISNFKKVGEHIRVIFDGEHFQGTCCWYVYEHHIEIFEGERKLHPLPPQSQLLKVPYKSQLDNLHNPNGSCNVTSLAMCMAYFGMTSSNGQLEDELYQYALSKGYSRHSPFDLARIVRDYGLKDTFKMDASIEEVKYWLNRGNPAVIHGYFTPFGHIIVAVGYDEKGFIFHDPYGEWFWNGYRTDLPGANLHYSYDLIRRVCMPDGDFWVHFISR